MSPTRTAIQGAVRAVIRKHRRIDILVNNAGVIHRENIVDTATADYRKVIETDLIGPFALAREVGRHMLAREYGRIVNISSIMAVLGRASVAGYVSAKHGHDRPHQEPRRRVRPARHRQRHRAGLHPHRAQRAAAEEQEILRHARAAHRGQPLGHAGTTCAARCCCSPPTPAPTSPATRWWSTAALTTILA